MRRTNGASAFGDGFGELLIRLGVLDAPPAQKSDQILGHGFPRRNGHNSRQRPPRLDEEGWLPAGVDALDQFWKTTGRVFKG
jgi:hypothetical protein